MKKNEIPLVIMMFLPIFASSKVEKYVDRKRK